MKTGKKEKPKPLVEKVAEATPPPDDTVGKIDDKKPPVVTDVAPKEQPKPDDKAAAEAAAAAKAEAAAKAADAKAKAEQSQRKSREGRGEARGKGRGSSQGQGERRSADESKSRGQSKPQAEASRGKGQGRSRRESQAEAKRAERVFDQSKIAALLDKRDPTRRSVTGRHAEFECRARPRPWQGRRQFRDLGCDVQVPGRALLEEALWRASKRR